MTLFVPPVSSPLEKAEAEYKEAAEAARVADNRRIEAINNLMRVRREEGV